MRFDDAFFERPLDRRNTNCEKWDDRAVMNEGGIPLWVADMDFPCAPAITETLKKRAEHPCFGYNIHNPADEQALIGFWQRRHGVTIQAGQTLMLPCVITGLKTCVRAFTQPGDAVAIFTPVYGPFYQAIEKNGRRVARVPLIMDGERRYQMNLEGMEEALKDGAKLIMLCNPHNPVSRLWNEEELTALCRLAQRYDVPLVSDEIHADFVYAPGKFTSILSVSEGRDRAVMLCAASKTFNVAGLQQATAVCFREDMRKALQAEMDGAGITSGNTFALLATRTAYTDCDEWLDGLMAYLDKNRKLLEKLVAECLPRAKMTPVDATYLAWLDLREYGYTCEELSKKFKDNGVALTGGTFFGTEGEGFMRVNFACPAAQLEEGIKRMRKALEEDE